MTRSNVSCNRDPARIKAASFQKVFLSVFIRVHPWLKFFLCVSVPLWFFYTSLNHGGRFAIVSIRFASSSPGNCCATGSHFKGRLSCFTTPPSNSALADGIEALATFGSKLTVWSLTSSGVWRRVQTVNVPIQYGSSG